MIRKHGMVKLCFRSSSSHRIMVCCTIGEFSPNQKSPLIQQSYTTPLSWEKQGTFNRMGESWGNNLCYIMTIYIMRSKSASLLSLSAVINNTSIVEDETCFHLFSHCWALIFDSGPANARWCALMGWSICQSQKVGVANVAWGACQRYHRYRQWTRGKDDNDDASCKQWNNILNVYSTKPCEGNTAAAGDLFPALWYALYIQEPRRIDD